MHDVIAIGAATLDVYLINKFNTIPKSKSQSALCFGLGDKYEIPHMHLTTGGGATNAAVTFARQGFKTACLAKIGNDIPGRLVSQELKEENITSFLVQNKSGHTAYSTLLLTPEGERVILTYRGVSEKLTLKDIPLGKLNTKWAYIASGGIEFTLLKKIINLLHSRGILIALNPGKIQLALGLKQLAPIVTKTKVFLVNREEASVLAGVKHNNNEREIFAKLDKAIGGILVVTDAERGSLVSDGHTIWRAGIFRERRLVDRTGAGDSFGSGFVAGLMQKNEKCIKGVCEPQNIAYAIRLASANATSNIETIGAKSGILTKSEFRQPRWSHLKINVIK